MLTITFPDRDFLDERTDSFIHIKGKTINLEHSLVSMSKWESKWHIPFLGKTDKTKEQLIDYIKCMTISQNVPDETYLCITDSIIEKINEYINNPMTASTVNDRRKNKKSREIVTAEIIYYWMISLGIPVEFQKWHLNKLLMLIRICDIKNSPGKKMSRAETLRQNAELNKMRRPKKH